MKIKNENIILRDMIESDIDDYVRWFTTETEWSNTDAPWESIESDEETERKSWREYYESVKDLADDVRRWKFEIERNGRHIGWVSSYPLTRTTNGLARSRTVRPFIVPSALTFANPMFGVTVSAQTLSEPL